MCVCVCVSVGWCIKENELRLAKMYTNLSRLHTSVHTGAHNLANRKRNCCHASTSMVVWDNQHEGLKQCIYF